MKEIQLKESEEHGYILELWGASTKHPDSIFYFSNFKKSPYIDDKHQVFQWLCECASKLNFPFHAENLIKYAWDNWRTWREDE